MEGVVGLPALWLSRNNPDRTTIGFSFWMLRNQNEVAEVAQLLHAQENAIKLDLDFDEIDEQDLPPLLNLGRTRDL